ncbi:MAG: DUF1349 domain-containing protein [Chlorobi bacterium]|nr:DUF1349 domain-containing protein [Chlorobiota bacterium]
MFSRAAFSLVLFCWSFIAIAQSDEFNSLNLGSQWSWIRENPDNWFLTSTELEIRTEAGALEGTSYNNVKNILLQDAPRGTFRFETRLYFNPDSMFHNAGLIYYIDDDNYIRVSRGIYETSINGVWMEFEVNASAIMDIVNDITASILYLRLSRTDDTIFTATYSLDGITWRLIGQETLHFPKRKARIGLQAANGYGITATPKSIPARFDYFRFAVTGVADRPAPQPSTSRITSIYPNPFNPATTIRYSVRRAGFTTLEIVDGYGRVVRTLAKDLRTPGTYATSFTGSGLPPGVYFARLKTTDGITYRPLLLLR